MKKNTLQLLCSLFLLLTNFAILADTVPVIDEDFEDPFTGYVFQTNTSTNATASMTMGDVSGSNGLVFEGTWDIAPDMVEFAAGILAPQTPPAFAFHIDPSEFEGITRINYSADTILNGFPGDGVGNLFLQLLIYQAQNDGSLKVFTQVGVITIITNTDLQNVGVSLVASDFVNFEGLKPNLGPNSNPISFGLQLGALFDDSAFTGELQGHLRVDNWVVTVEVPDRVFEDGFESE